MSAPTVFGQRQMESLGRGLVALHPNSTQIYVGWRLLGNDPDDIAFNLYRSANGGTPVKLNATPLTATTDTNDTPPNLATTAYTYSIRTVVGGVEVPDTWANPLGSSSVSLSTNPPVRQYIPIPLQSTPDGAISIGFCWVGDFDGDGEYDYAVERLNDLSEQRQFVEAYKRDGTFLWRMDMGPNSTNHYNIEPGSSVVSAGESTAVTVYDLDGDGRAEVIVRTANGVVFNNGSILSATNDNSQFISILNGLTGVELARAPVPNPYLADGPLAGEMGIIYADGKRPSVFLSARNRRDDPGDDQGFQGLTTVWDYRDGIITQRWSYDPDTLGDHAPHGHQLRLGDVDNDGRDEIIDIGYAIDDDGRQLFNTPEINHGDRYHMADINPDRPGLETFLIQQNNQSGLATALIESHTGKFIKKWYAAGIVDVGRGLAADIDPDHLGYELFSTQSGIYDAWGNSIERYGTSHPFPPEAVWWDGNLSREFLATVSADGMEPAIANFNPAAPSSQSRIYTFYNEAGGCHWLYGGRPPFWGDIMGDWREEVLVIANDNSELRLYNTVTAAGQRLYTLMHNPQYRIQTTTKGYVQASTVDYYLGTGMTPPPPPPMVTAKLVWRGGSGSTTWDSGATASWSQNGTNSTFTSGDPVRFDISSDASTPVVLNGTLHPGAVTVYSPNNHTFNGASGSLSGSMKLMKAGAGTLTLSGTHPFNGTTTIWDGALLVNGDLTQSPVTVWGGTWGGALARGLTGGRLGGTGHLSQPVTLGYRAAITPGNGMGNAGTLTLGSGLTAAHGSVLAFDLSDDPSGLSKTNDKLAITGNLSLTGTITLVINALNGRLAPGTYTLATYSGTLTGSATILAVTVPLGTPYTLSLGGGVLVLNVPATRAPAAVTWRRVGPDWDLASHTNWLRNGTNDVFVAGDTVTFDNTGASSPAVALATALPVSTLTVNATNDYTFTGPGSITGPGGLTKNGTGTLTVSTDNTYTGPTLVNGGVLAVDSLGDAGDPSAIGAAPASPTNLVLNGGTLRLTGSQTSANRGLTLGASGGTVDIATNGSSIQFSGTILGAGSLTKTGPGTLMLASSNSYAGGTTILEGKLYLTGSTPNQHGLGTGTVTLAGGTLAMADVQNYDVAAWNLVVPAGATGRLNADGRCSLTGRLTGSGTLNYYTPFIRTELYGNWSAFTGRINVLSATDGGHFRVNNGNGYGGAHIHLEAGTCIYYLPIYSATLDLGDLSGATNSVLSGGPTGGRTVTWRIGSRGTSSTFAGAIRDGEGPTALTKVGAGALTLSGSNTYSGATIVQGGTLVINGALTGSTVTVQSGAALGGNGTIDGDVTIQSGGGLGFTVTNGVVSGLNIEGNLALNGTIQVSPVPGSDGFAQGTYTILTVTGTITGAPVLVWAPPPGSTQQAVFDTNTPGRIAITVTRNAGTLVWTGAASPAWDTSSTNWTLSGVVERFMSGDTALFNDTRISTNATVSISGTLAPGATIVSNSTLNYTLASSGGGISGTGTLVKAGSGTLSLTGTNTHSGGLRIQAGTVRLDDEAANTGAWGSGPITLEGGVLQQYDNTGTYSSPTCDLRVPAGANATLRMDSRIDLYGSLAGSGTLNLYLPYTRTTLRSDCASFAGQLTTSTDADGGALRLCHTNGMPGAALNLTNGVTIQYFGNLAATIPLGEVSGMAGARLSGLNNNNSAVGSYTLTWLVGGRGTDATFAGAIGNGTSPSKTALTKTGSGTWTISGPLTYTGPTLVSSGVLNVLGSLTNASTIEVLSGATLNLGGGTLNVASVIIRSNGVLSGSGMIKGALLNQGTIVGNGTAAWIFNGPATNAAGGVIRLTAGATFTATNGLVNAGTLDLITANSPPPAGMTGSGVVLTAASVIIPSLALDGISTRLALTTHVGHTYQLQQTTALTSGSWQAIGSPLSGTGSNTLFTAPRLPEDLLRFYRILVSP